MDTQEQQSDIEMPQGLEIAPSVTTLVDKVNDAWRIRCSALGEEEKKEFESSFCRGSDMAEYVKKLEDACQQHRHNSLGFKIMDWFEPIFKAVELFTPAASVAIGAHPNPASLVLGGIVAVVQITSRSQLYQKLTVQMLARMGRKASVLSHYERDVYNDDVGVQMALVDVYGDIIAFCQKAVQPLKEDGKFRAKVKSLKLTFFRDFSSHLGKEVQDFENHFEEVEYRACLCDRKRIKELREIQQVSSDKIGRVVEESREHFQRQEDLVLQLLKREQDLRERDSRREREREKGRLLDWLSTESFLEKYDAKCEDHLEGTGSWLLEDETYKEWKFGNESNRLWVRGKPGCGKSMLAAVIVTDLSVEVTPETALAYAFCSRGDESSENPLTILRALAKQIIYLQRDISPDLESEYNASQRGKTPSRNTVRKAMRRALSYFTRTYVVIDALDECKGNGELAEDLIKLMDGDLGSCLKIVVFSRYDRGFEERFNPYKQIHPDLGANEDDLKAYIESLFPDNTHASVNRQIREACIAKADGMFQWVKLLEQSLRKSLRVNHKLKRIEQMLPGLERMYDTIMQDIWEQAEDVRSIAFLVLLWVTNARRPLRSSEMLEAVADYSETSTVGNAFKESDPEQLVAICMNLVIIDKLGYFRLCHESARSYLDKTGTNSQQPLTEYQIQERGAHKRWLRFA